MVIVRIAHPVNDFTTWKEAFDRDPVGRQRGGVRRYRIVRAIDEPDSVSIDLEFDDIPTATRFRDGLVQLWGSGAAQALGIGQPRATLLEEAETVAL
ncbi:MAG: hypothetical protein ACSLFN_12635 [Candidatus Limnocylindrales bacterium]